MTPKAVIFDCDGVIVDSEGPTLVLLQRDLARFGMHLSLQELDDGFVGGTIASVEAEARARGARLPVRWKDDFYELLYAELAKGTQLVPGILGMLDLLDGGAIPYAVGSNGSDRKMKITLGQHPGLIARFQGRLFSAQTLGRPKPAPDVYLHAARALGVVPEDCVIVEDSPTGCAAAKAAGIRCFGYAATGDGARLRANGATVFRDMADLPALLGL